MSSRVCELAGFYTAAPCCAAALPRRSGGAARFIFPNLGPLQILIQISHILFMTFANSGAEDLPAHLPQSGAPPCGAAVLRRRAIALRSVRSSSDAFAEPPAPLIILNHGLARAWFLAAPAFI